MSDSEDTDKYFHHTDIASAKQIQTSGKILQSRKANGDAIAGDGTYLTKLGPSVSKKSIAKNNYDGANQFWEKKVDEGKTKVAIEVKLPKNKVEDHSAATGRDIHKYPGSISLENKDVKFHVRTEKGVKTYETKKKNPKPSN